MKTKLFALIVLILLPLGIWARVVEIDGINYSLTGGTKTAYVIYKSEGYSGDVVIPASVNYAGDSYSVTRIEQSAFYGDTGLASITIPNSVTYIGGSAFYGCTGLTSIDIPNSVESIGSYAFYGCSGLTSVIIGNSVTRIGGTAFYGCTGLTSVNIPNSVTIIEGWAFEGCTGLTSINIPNSVTHIGSSAFRDCTGLMSINIPNSVTYIASDAFRGCSGLTSIKVGAGNRVYDSRDNCNAIIETASNTLKVGCQSSTIPNSVTVIGFQAFEDCTSLTSVNIHNSVYGIEHQAFQGCTGLTSINIPHSVTYIGNAFKGCTGLTSIKVDAGNTEYDSRNNCNAIIETASNTLKVGCQSSTIPNSVTTIRGEAFYKCTGLTSVNIPNSVTTIGDYAFYKCTGLTSINIPNSVTHIGDDAFSGCSGLTSIKVDKNNSVYDSRADCNALIETASNTLLKGCINTVIPNSVTTIGDDAFYGCTGLTSIDIPNSVESIGNSAFRGCTGLISVKIPNSVTSIENYAFYNCTGLTDVYALRTEPRVYDASRFCFDDVLPSSSTLHVPAGCEAAYRAFEPWSKFVNIVEDAATGIAAPSMDNEIGSMSNGQRSMIYDLLGRRMAQPARGIYIQKDGRKLIR